VGKRAHCSACDAHFLLNPEKLPHQTTHPAGPLTPAPSVPAEEDVFPLQLAAELLFQIASERPRLPEPAAGALAPREELVPPARQRRRKKKETARSRGPWVVLAAGAGAVLLVVVGLVWWLGRGGAGGDDGGASLVREPGEARYGLNLAALAVADPATWKVRPDGVKLAANLHSAFADPDAGVVEAILFGAPDTARAAVLNAVAVPILSKPDDVARRRSPWKLEWLRYDLRSSQPLGRVTVAEYWGEPAGQLGSRWDAAPDLLLAAVCRTVADLSPSGNVLAFRPEGDATRIEVWGADGKRLADLKSPDKLSEVAWVGLLDDTRLLMLSDGQLTLRELPSGRTVYSAGNGLRLPVTFSPGRKWAAAFAGDGFTWVQTADGAIGGKLPIPKLPHLKLLPLPAVSPDGRSFAALLHYEEQTALVVWDVATGKPRQGSRHPGQVPGAVAALNWCRPRHLLIAGQGLIDVEENQQVWGYHLRLSTRFSLGSPDGRFWYAAYFHRQIARSDRPEASELEPILAQLKEPQLREDFKKSRALLVAATVPHPEVMERAAAARKGFLWRPGTAVRVEVRNADRMFCRLAEEKLADALAAQGYRIDPSAPLTARLVVPEPRVREHEPMRRWVKGEVISVGGGTSMRIDPLLEIVDGSGKVWLSVGGGQFVAEATRDAEVALRNQIVAGLHNFRLPEFEALDANRTHVRFPPSSRMGIDGILAPTEAK
jgi:hypothetical protein